MNNSYGNKAFDLFMDLLSITIREKHTRWTVLVTVSISFEIYQVPIRMTSRD